MMRSILILMATVGSAAMMLGALGFQYIGDLAPCKMCIWQRWPHVIAILIGIVALTVLKGSLVRVAAWLGAVAAFTTGAIGIFHTGVERGWWEGPTSCSGTGAGLSGMSGSDLLSTEDIAMPILCDQVAWEMLGLSMASWNSVASFVFCAIWVMAARR